VRLYLLSGAGLSAPSGLATFRDGGLWDRYDVVEVCSIQGYRRDPHRVHRFYDERRQELGQVRPNRAHYYLAKLEERFDVVHLTQNVDDLLERAGAQSLIHLHGELTKLRCLECGHSFSIGYLSQEGKSCPGCGSCKVRPDVIFFGESAPNYRYLYTIEADLFIAIGTSGRVIDIADIAQHYPRSILIDPVRHKRVTMFGEFDCYIDEYFTHFIQADICEALEELELLLQREAGGAGDFMD